MKNQVKCQVLPIKEEKDVFIPIGVDYFINTSVPNYADRRIDEAPLRRTIFSKEELDKIRQEADEMGLPDTLDCLND
jgi:hypothetical protein